MPHALRIIAALLSLIMASGVAHAQNSKKYPVLIDRPWKAGQTYQIHIAVMEIQHLLAKVEGRDDSEDDDTTNFHFIADATVESANASARSLEVSYTVRHCFEIDGADTSEYLPAGTELLFTMSKGEAQVIATNGGVENYQLTKVKDAIVASSLGTAGTGTFPAKAVGETWSINTGATAKFLEKNDKLLLNSKGVKGTATLVDVSESGATPSMKVRVDIDVKDFKIRELKQLKFSVAKAKFDFVGDFPVDHAKGPSATKASAEMTVKASGKVNPRGPNATLEAYFTREVTAAYTYN